MKRLLNVLQIRRAIGFGPPVFTLLLAVWTARGDSGYTSIGWITDVPVPPIVGANGAGQVLLRGYTHIVAVQSTDARLTGNRLIFANASVQADGTALVWGTCYQQVGTFDPNTNFTATAGLWEISYRGVMQADYSLQLSLAGYGCGGAIEGQRIVETMTRGPASGPTDPTVPYLYTGTLKSAPVNTTESVNDFSLPYGVSTWGEGTCSVGDGLFYAVGDRFQRTSSVYDSYVFGQVGRSWNVPDGMTLEWRADLVSIDDNATNTAILAVGTDSGPGYAFHKGRDFAFLLKWSSSFATSILWSERPPNPLPTGNVVQALALTRIGTDVVINTRVLAKNDSSTVLFQHSFADTPDADQSLNTTEFKASSGINFQDLVTDAMEAPPRSFWALLGAFQNTDGSQPVPTAIWDNLELRTSEIPAVNIARAVQVYWPAPAGKYDVEGAPTVDGPWRPVQDLQMPGIQQMTIPANEIMEFFRLIQAPQVGNQLLLEAD